MDILLLEENPTNSKGMGMLAVALTSYANPLYGTILILLMIGPKMNAMSIILVLFNFGILF